MAEQTIAEKREKLQAALGKVFGKNVLKKASEFPPVEFIKSGIPMLDYALTGGIPRGRVVEFWGPRSGGKTSTAGLYVAGEQRFQLQQADPRSQLWIDRENTFDIPWMTKLGVDCELLDLIRDGEPDSKGNPVFHTAEDVINLTIQAAESGVYSMIVWDSLAAVTPKAKVEGKKAFADQKTPGSLAALMSETLPHIVAVLSKFQCTLVIINQYREKIGVMYGCFEYHAPVILADGTTDWIGRIVNQRKPVEVLSFDPGTGKVSPKRVIGWHENGVSEEFVKLTVEKPFGNGRSSVKATGNHRIMTPQGWREAQSIKVGDKVCLGVSHWLSSDQEQMVIGSVLGDGSLRSRRGRSVQFRISQGTEQEEYLDWKVSQFENVNMRKTRAGNGFCAEATPLYELRGLYELIYGGGTKKRHVPQEVLDKLTPLAWSVWYMDDGAFQVRNNRGGGRASICIKGFDRESQERIERYFRERGIDCSLRARGSIDFTVKGTEKFHSLIAPYVHPSMEYKLMEEFRGRFNLHIEQGEKRYVLEPLTVTGKEWIQGGKKYDITVEGNHTYFVDWVAVHNSPATRPGGNALEHYASQILEVKQGDFYEAAWIDQETGAELGKRRIGNDCRVRVQKNKCGPCWREATTPFFYDKGVDLPLLIRDLSMDLRVVEARGRFIYHDAFLATNEETGELLYGEPINVNKDGEANVGSKDDLAEALRRYPDLLETLRQECEVKIQHV